MNAKVVGKWELWGSVWWCACPVSLRRKKVVCKRLDYSRNESVSVMYTHMMTQPTSKNNSFKSAFGFFLSMGDFRQVSRVFGKYWIVAEWHDLSISFSENEWEIETRKGPRVNIWLALWLTILIVIDDHFQARSHLTPFCIHVCSASFWPLSLPILLLLLFDSIYTSTHLCLRW